MKNILVLLVAVLISGCGSANVNDDGGFVITVNPPPNLWSDHKYLDIPVNTCALKALSALSSLGFTGVIQNGNFLYGNFNDNRAAVKCVESSGGSFVYFAVAGPNKSIVEKLRNEIAWKL